MLRMSRRARGAVFSFCMDAISGARGSRKTKNRMAAAWVLAAAPLELRPDERARAVDDYVFLRAMTTATLRGPVVASPGRSQDDFLRAAQGWGDSPACQGGRAR